jgi:hypothetical protein
LALFLIFEFLYVVASFRFLEYIWWTVHLPSAFALGADEILERHGKVVSTVFHLADFLIWSAVVTSMVALWGAKRKREKAARDVEN